MPCHQLLTLFDSILVPVLSEWISDEDLCFADTAVCNRKHREGFLLTLSRCYISATKFYRINAGETFEWIIHRGIGLKRIELSHDEPKYCHIPQLLFLMGRTVNLSYLSVDLTQIPVNSLLSIAMTVHTLEVVNSDDDSLVLLLTTWENAVAHLDISQCLSLSDNVFTKIAILCPGLASIRLPPHGAILASLLVACEIVFVTNDLKKPRLDDESNYTLKLSTSSGDSGFGLPMDKRTYAISELDVGSAWLPLKLTEEDVEIISPHIYNLRLLCLGSGYLPSLLKSVVANCLFLQEFTATVVRFAEKDLIRIGNNCCLHLRVLKLYNCGGITENDILEATQSCLKLNVLRVESTPVSDTTVTLLQAQCPLLSTLQLLDCFSGNVLNIAKDFDTVDFLHGNRGCYSISESKLKNLSTTANTFLDYRFFQQNASLVHVEFHGVQLMNEVLKNLVQYCPAIRKFGYHHRSELIPPNLLLLAQCRGLTRLIVARMKGITDDLLEALLTDKPEFFRLDLCQSSGFSHKVCQLVGRLCPQMRYLDVTRASDVIPFNDVVDLLDKCPRLHSLCLMSYPSEDQSRFVSNLPRKLRSLLFEYRRFNSFLMEKQQ